ncbi:glucuronate isomerase [Polaribacter staleyi]|uniref:glucuronate isomerase n=1 Tax=Polaribacter staleyi TaxID=2022337 RepID=UPI003BF493DF
MGRNSLEYLKILNIHHDYFKRILCNLLGNDIEKGLIPHDKELLSGMVKDICYYNSKKHFKFD